MVLIKKDVFILQDVSILTVYLKIQVSILKTRSQSLVPWKRKSAMEASMLLRDSTAIHGL